MTTGSRFGAAWAGALLLTAAAGCRPAPPPAEAPPPERVENAAHGLVIAALPAPFRVERNEGPTLRLAADLGEEAGTGLLTIDVGPALRTSINLIDETKARKAWFEGEASGGRYFGNRELLAPYGPAFTARGEFDVAEGRVEETWIYTLHPMANRLITLVYRYPAGGDSASRVQEAMEVLGELEPLTGDDEAGAAAAADEG